MTSPFYQLSQVTKQYHQRTILQIDQLTIQTGEMLALVGPSGAGKSTLLRLLNFLETPSSGTLYFQGIPFATEQPMALAQRRLVTTVFQRPLLLNRTVWANVEFGLQLRHRRSQVAVDRALEIVGLRALANQPAQTLSSGEAQRVALARAIVIEPTVLLLDEPTANLDPIYAIFLLLSLLAGACQPIVAPPAAETDAASTAPATAGKLILATTTSTQDSGLLEVILPLFEAEAGVDVEVIAVGTGQALKLGEDGNADVLLVHARKQEDAFMQAGHGIRREDVMYNDFVLVGPADDPAGVADAESAADAFAKLAATEAPFVSRGDDSGTHSKEKAVWAAAAIEPAGDWYISAGQGMGAVLTMANEQLAYTLSDRATYLARTLEGTDLVILYEGDPLLFNPYGVIAVNPEKSPQIQADLADQFIDWLISVPTQAAIADFGVEQFGVSLFTPDSVVWRAQ